MSTLIGIVTFGNLGFTKLTIKGIEETVTEPYLIYAVVGKPDDVATQEWLSSKNIPHVVHNENYGFPYSVNDIYDFAWKDNNFDNIVMIGNDVIPYPYAIDSMIKVADTTNYDWICAKQFDARTLVNLYPETRKYFKGPHLVFENFKPEPWKVPAGYSEEIEIVDTPLSDVHNLALFKKSVFDAIGYIDVNFYPAYYEDNDYVRRAVHANLKSCTLGNAIYFHFWSRTIHQETGGSTHKYFQMNRNFYTLKWGGDFGREQYELPFGGEPYTFHGVSLPPVIKIDSRDDEKMIIKSWRSLRH